MNFDILDSFHDPDLCRKLLNKLDRELDFETKAEGEKESQAQPLLRQESFSPDNAVS